MQAGRTSRAVLSTLKRCAELAEEDGRDVVGPSIRSAFIRAHGQRDMSAQVLPQLQSKVMRSIVGDKPALRFGGATNFAKVEFATKDELVLPFTQHLLGKNFDLLPKSVCFDGVRTK
jgi:hypothetical protein